MTEIQKRLFSLQDIKYKKFHSKLIPTVDENLIIGVRVPLLRKLAKEISYPEECNDFLKSLPHKYYEENNLHAFIIENIKDYKTCIKELELFLPYIDNWATCDSLRPKVFRKKLNELLNQIRIWISSKNTFTVRFGILCLMIYFLKDENFDNSFLELVANIYSEEYYIKMMQAWYFATALHFQYDATIKFLEERKLDVWVHNKTIQKAIESNLISKETKIYLRSLKKI